LVHLIYLRSYWFISSTFGVHNILMYFHISCISTVSLSQLNNYGAELELNVRLAPVSPYVFSWLHSNFSGWHPLSGSDFKHGSLGFSFRILNFSCLGLGFGTSSNSVSWISYRTSSTLLSWVWFHNTLKLGILGLHPAILNSVVLDCPQPSN